MNSAVAEDGHTPRYEGVFLFQEKPNLFFGFRIKMNSMTGNKTLARSKALLAAAVCLFAGCDRAPNVASLGSMDVRRDPTVAAIERAMPSVVNIRAARAVPQNETQEEVIYRNFFGIKKSSEPQINSIGSGVIIDEVGDDGFILTNLHVIKDESRVQVQLQDGREYEAEQFFGTGRKILLASGKKDLALLRITRKHADKPFKPIRLAKDDDLLLGETVIAVGNPFGLGGSVTRGILSAKNRRSTSGSMALNYQDWLQTDADINPGNSGGALINLRGELIGINVAVYGQDEGKGTGFAIPVKQISALLSDIFSLERTAKLWLGARFRGAAYSMAVCEVQPNSPAYRAGLRVGQQVLSVNRKSVTGLGELNLHIASRTNLTADILVLDNGRKKEVKVEMLPMELVLRQVILAKLGITTKVLTPEQAATFQMNVGEGLMVIDVEKGSPAAGVNLTPGIVLILVDGFPVFDQVNATNTLGNKKSGTNAVLTLGFLNRYANGLTEIRSGQVELAVR